MMKSFMFHFTSKRFFVIKHTITFAFLSCMVRWSISWWICGTSRNNQSGNWTFCKFWQWSETVNIFIYVFDQKMKIHITVHFFYSVIALLSMFIITKTVFTCYFAFFRYPWYYLVLILRNVKIYKANNLLSGNTRTSETRYLYSFFGRKTIKGGNCLLVNWHFSGKKYIIMLIAKSVIG